jgi:glycosyltransferase involved in cell wall biosynthesis
LFLSDAGSSGIAWALNKVEIVITIVYGFQFQHHGKYSSFWGLSRYLDNCKIVDVSLPLPTLIPATIRSILFNKWLRINEYRFYKCFKNVEPHLFHYYHPENCLFKAGKWKNRHKLVLTCHQPLSKYKQMIKSAKFNGFFYGLSHADCVVVLSKTEEENIKIFSPQAKIMTIPLGVDTDYFRPSKNLSNRSVVLTIGNWLRDYQCWANVVNDLSIISREIEFIVVANQDTIRSAKKHLGETNAKVVFYSGVSDEYLKQIYHRSSILFLPLTDAVANNSLLEGMACGLPVVVRDLPAVREYLGESSGILIAEHKVENYVKAIVSLVKDSSLRCQLGNNARKRAEKEFSWRIIADQYKGFYQTLI